MKITFEHAAHIGQLVTVRLPDKSIRQGLVFWATYSSLPLKRPGISEAYLPVEYRVDLVELDEKLASGRRSPESVLVRAKDVLMPDKCDYAVEIIPKFKVGDKVIGPCKFIGRVSEIGYDTIGIIGAAAAYEVKWDTPGYWGNPMLDPGWNWESELTLVQEQK